MDATCASRSRKRRRYKQALAGRLRKWSGSSTASTDCSLVARPGTKRTVGYPKCMSDWLPKLEAVGLPVPRTALVRMPREAFQDVLNVFDGKPIEGPANEFLRKVAAAATEIGYPAFLPTMPLAVCTRYGGMPMCREFRCFVADAEVRCMHPYWTECAAADDQAPTLTRVPRG